MDDPEAPEASPGPGRVNAVLSDPANWTEVQPLQAQVIPMRGEGNRLKPRARALVEHVTFSGEIERRLESPYLVKRWIARGSLVAVFAPPNAGKSFMMLDMSYHVDRGLMWGGQRTQKGRVLYLAAEGGAGFANRVAALPADRGFWVLTHGLTLTGPRADSAPLVEMIAHLSKTGGRFDMIVIDTLSRVLGDAEEDQRGFNDLVKNLDLVIAQTGAAVVLIHHSGKDTLQGMRGSSVLRAAIDTEIKLTRDDDGVITAETTKQRDGPTGYKFRYTLRQVVLGQDQDGDVVTTCVVEPVVEPAETGRAGLWEASIRALAILDQCLASAGEVIRKPTLPGTPSVPLVDWAEACLSDRGVSAATVEANRRRQFQRCRDQLAEARMILVRDDRVWRVEK